MSVERRLMELGGIATYRQLVTVAGREELDRAVEAGRIVRVARGRFASAEVDTAHQQAHALCGVLSHASAALDLGWALKLLPAKPHVIVPVKRKVESSRQVHLHRRDLLPEEHAELRTSRDLTLEQCLRTMPYDEALAVADSALRDGYPPERLRAMARDARGPGSAALRVVARMADGRAANPFESVLRALCHGVPGLDVRPQVQIGPARVDLADEQLRVVLEADSFAWHGDRRALRRDARRYNRLVVEGWMVLRFSWEDVMFEQEAVQHVLERACAHRRSNQPL